jgi:NTP pyrophosphatase (non-canonical NTP hydrolase)
MSIWKYTIPVTRAYEEDGRLFIEGEASGPERDTHKTRMLPEAIIDFARQIRDRFASGNPVPYYDSHLKMKKSDGSIFPKTALAELGVVVDGYVKDDFHLGVRVELDSENPASRFIYNNVHRGKHYGMSVAGSIDPKKDVMVTRLESGERDIAFKRVELDEISHTTSPSWLPSLGTVLARSLDGEDEDDFDMTKATDELGLDAGVSLETPAEEPAESAQPDAESEPVTTDEQRAEETTEATEEVVEVERARIAAKDREEFANLLAAVLDKAKALGIEIPAGTPEQDAPETPPAESERSETGDEESQPDESGTDATAVERMVSEAIERALAGTNEVIERQRAYIEQLENMPAGKLPPALVRDKFANPLVDEIVSIEDPSARLKAALNRIYENH